MTESGRMAPSVPSTLAAIPGRLKPAFCLQESCYFKYTDLNGVVKIVTHLFQEVLANYGIVDVLDRLKYQDGVLLLAKTKLNDQTSPVLKLFHVKKNIDGSPNLKEVPWPVEIKSSAESSNLADMAAAGERVGILVDQIFLILRLDAGQFNLRMQHLNISQARTSADTRRNPSYSYDLGNVFDNEKSKRLYRISDDFLLREGGAFYVISPRDPQSDLFPIVVPNSTSLQGSFISADNGTSTIYFLIQQDYWNKAVFKLEK